MSSQHGPPRADCSSSLRPGASRNRHSRLVDGGFVALIDGIRLLGLHRSSAVFADFRSLNIWGGRTRSNMRGVFPTHVPSAISGGNFCNSLKRLGVCRSARERVPAGAGAGILHRCDKSARNLRRCFNRHPACRAKAQLPQPSFPPRVTSPGRPRDLACDLGTAAAASPTAWPPLRQRPSATRPWHGRRPFDIEQAQRKAFSPDPARRDLQVEAVAHPRPRAHQPRRSR